MHQLGALEVADAGLEPRLVQDRGSQLTHHPAQGVDLGPELVLAPLEQVPGNCDFGRFEALERVLILDDHRVLIAHGHTLGVKTGLLRAQYRALEMNADILLFGHTHVPLVDAASRPMMMNPGSIGDPRRPTYGVLEFRDGQIYPSVFRLDA